MKIKYFAYSILFLLSFSNMVYADYVTFNFTGTVTSVDTQLSGQFNTSQTLSGFYTFDSNTADIDADFNIGNYLKSLISLSVTIGNYTATLGLTPFNWITVWNYDPIDGVPFIDAYSVRSDKMTGNSINGLDPIQFVLTFYDTTHNMINSDDLPLLPPNIPNYRHSWNLGFAQIDTPGTRADVFGEITSLTLVPEPATILLISFGLIGLIGARKKIK
jgi:hypothetical protein